MAIEDFIRGTIQQAVDLSRHALPDSLAWATAPIQRVLEYLTGPLIDHGGRYPWWALTLTLMVATAAFLFDRRRSGMSFVRFCFPKEIWRHRSTWVDIKVGFFNYVLFGGGALNLTWRFSAAWFTALITTWLTAWFGVNEHPAPWGPVSVVLFAIGLSMAADFGYFLFHWTAHVFPPLWAIHKVHHSAEVMTPLTAARVHALEHPIMGIAMAASTGLLAGPMLYLFGGETSLPTILGLDFVAVAFFALGQSLNHSHIWIYFGPIVGRLIVSPAQHQIHHSCLPRHLDKNFAEHWSIFDTIFGTLYLPNGRETLKLGLAGYQKQPHPGAVAAFFRPIGNSAQCALSLGRRLIGMDHGAAAAQPSTPER